MVKNILFSALLLLVGVLLFLLRATGLFAHMGLSVVGLVLLVVYTMLTKKDWRIPALEISMRVFYAIALISGVLMMRLHMPLLAVAHKGGGVFFVVALIVVTVHKLCCKGK